MGSALDPPGTLGRLPGPLEPVDRGPGSRAASGPDSLEGVLRSRLLGPRGIPSSVSPQVTGRRGGRKPHAETGCSEKQRLVLFPPYPALTTLTLKGPALPSALMRRWGGARRPGSQGSSWTRSDPAPGTKGRQMGRMGGGQGCRGRREGTLGLSVSESVVAECAGSREAALWGGIYRSTSWHLQPSQAT